MEYLVKYSRITLLTVSVIFIALALKSIICFMQTVACRLHLYLSLRRTRLTKRFFWTEEQIANSTTTVTSLYVYHVKSIRPVSCQKVTIDNRGIAGDRRFMLVAIRKVPLCGAFQPGEATHRFLTQCHYPSLMTIASDIVMSETDPQKSSLHFTSTVAGESRTFTIAMHPDPNAPVYRTTLWDDVVNVHDMGDEAAMYFQSILEHETKSSETLNTSKSVRLVVQCESDHRFANERFVPSALRSIFGCNPRMHLGSAYPV
jgi:MOSC N-terminal beta barrel domain